MTLELLSAWLFVIGGGLLFVGCVLNLGRVTGWWS